MHVLSRAALLAIGVTLASAAATARRGEAPRATPRVASPDGPGLSAVCPPGTIPDGDACVPLPEEDDVSDGEEAPVETGAHHDKRGRYAIYEQIPRRPDRPEGYDAYAYPVARPARGALVLSGYDLDRPDAEQRRGRALSHVGHGGLDLAGLRGDDVRALRLEHQEGAATVVHAGKLFGTTVVTRHVVREGGRLVEYVLVHGHLDDVAEGVAKGREVAEGAVLGHVGDSGHAGVVHLHLEARRVRDGVDVSKLAPEALVAGDKTIVCDPRNVLPLAAPR